MESYPAPRKHTWKDIATSRPFWVVTAMLVGVTLLHYLIPEARSPLSQGAERVLFIAPIASAALAFGHVGGLVALAVAVLAMLPRAIWLSPRPADALVETGIIIAVGYLLTWMIAARRRGKGSREKAVEKLKTVNALTTAISQSLDPDEILEQALLKVLEMTGLASRGGIFLLGTTGRGLWLRAHRDLPPEFVQRETEIVVGECPFGLAIDSGEVLFSSDVPEHMRHDLWGALDSRGYVLVPLKSRDRVLGLMALYLREGYGPSDEDRWLLASVGNQVGMAVENARLYENLRFYIRAITRAQENERMRIAQELHDDTIQMFIAISRRLEALAALLKSPDEPALRQIGRLQELTASALRGVRLFVQDLRPPILDHLGLVAALEGLVSVTEREGIEAELGVTGAIRRLRPEEELVLFRIAQEALNNVRRHSAASQVAVRLEFHPARVQMTLNDDGCGFNTPARLGDLAAMGKLGLIGMHERARILGGTLRIQSEPGAGTAVTVDVPVQPEPRGGPPVRKTGERRPVSPAF